MTREEKQTNLRLARRRYSELKTRGERGALLDQFCEMTGLSRKHAIRLLSPHRPKPSGRRGRPRGYGPEVQPLLVRIWELADRPCAKLLVPVLGLWVQSLRRSGQDIPPEVAGALLRMSASSIDRRLRCVRPRAGRGARRASSLAEHRREVPLKIDAWPADYAAHPGYEEADMVALCGGSMAGSFAWGLTLTDTGTQWTEGRVTWNNGARAVAGRLREALAELPFPVRGLNTDNGPEFLNAHLAREFPNLCPGASRTRSRPYEKNDNAHVEQKNGHRMRRLFGFGRHGRREAVEAMNELARLQSLFDNLYRPTQKLLSKERVEGTRKWRKHFEKQAKTPAQRVLGEAAVPEAFKERVRDLLAANDPQRLRKAIAAARRRVGKINAECFAREQAAAAPGGRDSALRAAPSGPSPADRGGGAQTATRAAPRSAAVTPDAPLSRPAERCRQL